MNVHHTEYLFIFNFPIGDIILALFRFVFIALIPKNQGFFIVLWMKYLPRRF